MGISRVEYDGRLLIDISSDTVKEENLLEGQTAHNSNGDAIVGTCPFDMKTTEFTAFAEHILEGKTAGVNKQMVTGTMKDNAAEEHNISKATEVFKIPQGYHDGNGTVKIKLSEMNKLKPENIRAGVEILGVSGEMTGTEGENPSPTITVKAPLKEDLSVQPEGDYTCFKEVIVEAVPYEETDKTTDNKGIWVKIG